jgi:hypothetical protein
VCRASVFDAEMPGIREFHYPSLMEFPRGSNYATFGSVSDSFAIPFALLVQPTGKTTRPRRNKLRILTSSHCTFISICRLPNLLTFPRPWT